MSPSWILIDWRHLNLNVSSPFWIWMDWRHFDFESNRHHLEPITGRHYVNFSSSILNKVANMAPFWIWIYSAPSWTNHWTPLCEFFMCVKRDPDWVYLLPHKWHENLYFESSVTCTSMWRVSLSFRVKPLLHIWK